MTATAVGPACTQPGCTGTIVDGWCDVCGSPGTAAAAPAPAPRSTVGPPPAVASGRCTQPGCTGTVVDGYCDVCGTPAGTPAAETPLAPQPGGAGSTVTRGSSRLGSTALGSSRLNGGASRATRRVGSGSQRLRAARLGAGLTRVPPAPVVDAANAVLVDASVPENKRSCARCGKPVGRSRDGRPGRPEGFCASCGAPYSFTPKLKAGDLVAGQYAVAGALAHGGLGWIYLARDKNVSDRWVVLKGLLNSGDPDALAAAIAEQQFLAAVEHPLIVEIYNFVTHEGAGYIVMEYVGGVSLKQILKERMRANHGVFDPLPVDQALAYILEVLPAFTYLHDLGLVYCDFKPDNLIQVGDAVKLIDLGGVRRIDDDDSAIYGTVGYQAPEVAQLGPSVASDIYTIGRTLTVLMTEFRGYQTTYVASLPPVADTPVLASHDSLHRLLLKACAPDPADRFSSADELRVQLLGVLREVVAAHTPGTALTSAASVLFEAPAITGGLLEARDLPSLRVDTTDPQHAWLSNVSAEDPADRLTFLQTAPALSPEVLLAQARAALELQRPDLVAQAVDQMLRADPWEWRAVWMSGLAALEAGDFGAAQSAFNAVYGQVPGELAPKLALALACERGGEPDVAEGLYTTCAGTDANYVAAGAFGLARLRSARGDVPGAVAALDLVPSTSRAFSDSRRLRAVALAGPAADLPQLAQALGSLEGVRLDPHERGLLTAGILERALARAQSAAPLGTPGPPAQALTVGRYAAQPDALRDGLEATYRELARSEDDEARSHAWVDRANAVRRWTLR
ncbi:serine/threonine-protein kinase [Microlunatus antarcticus]|uniref:non-specific serine/threonine protein kinase n=1 Tax=Microlunatus antarcticus TaxID=53388 RepID=A0A7W5P7J7_9ACTN|nr:serine/threonine-protein kinase PknG [Microlunatus antarcticus]